MAEEEVESVAGVSMAPLQHMRTAAGGRPDFGAIRSTFATISDARGSLAACTDRGCSATDAGIFSASASPSGLAFVLIVSRHCGMEPSHVTGVAV